MIDYQRTSDRLSSSDDFSTVGSGLKIYLKGTLVNAKSREELLHKATQAYRGNTLDTLVSGWNGFFTLIVLDPITKVITFVSDRLGYDFHFYSSDDQGLVISPDFWTCVKHQKTCDLDSTSLIEFLRYRYPTADHTLVQGVHTFPPGALTSIKCKPSGIEISVEHYYQFIHRPTLSDDLNLSSILDSTLRTAVDQQIETTDGKLGLTLTGGADSRYLFSMLYPTYGEQLQTYTFGGKRSEEVQCTQRVVEQYPTAHVSVDLSDGISSFYAIDTIDRLLSQIGHSTYYYQAYGWDRLMAKIPSGTHLICGTDAFMHGRTLSEDLVNRTWSQEELASYICTKVGVQMTASLCQSVLGHSESQQRQALSTRAMTCLSTDGSAYSRFSDWNYKQYFRRCINAYYPAIAEHCNLSYPFNDHRVIDLGLAMPIAAIRHQSVYLQAMYKHGFVDEMSGLKDLAYELRTMDADNSGNYRFNNRKRPLTTRVINKVYPVVDHRQSHPISHYIRSEWKPFLQQIDELLEDSSSSIVDTKMLRKLIVNQRFRSLEFFHKPLSSILSILRMERLLRNT